MEAWRTPTIIPAETASDDATAEIPGRSPLYGLVDLLAILRDPVRFVRSRYDQFGPVSWFRIMGRKVVLLLGPEANEFALRNTDNRFSNKIAWEWVIGSYFRGGLMLRDFEEHFAHRRIMQVAFRRSALERYLEAMNPQVSGLLDRWQPDATGRLLMFPTLKQLTLDLASNVFLGEDLGPRADAINRAFVDTVRASGPGSIVRYPIPGTLAWKGRQGRKLLEQYFLERIPAKREATTADFFAEICQAETEEGERFSDRDIVDHMIFLLMAAHDTTNITMNSMFYYLAKYPEWQARCREEARALGDRPLDMDDLPKLQTLERVMKESLRLVPPVPGLPRATVTDCDFGGYRIPAGTMVSVSPMFTHLMEAYWTDPMRFDPERFSPERAEDRSHKFAYLPFGGGVHKCIGLHFADLQVKGVMTQILGRFEWSVPAGYELRIDNTSLPRPVDDLPVSIRPLPPEA